MNKKKEFIHNLEQQHIFWCYDLSQQKSIDDNLVIEHTLLYADVPYLIKLFEIYDIRQIKRVWEQRIVPDRRYKKLNYYLAKIFFSIPLAEKFIEKIAKANNRYEKIRKLASSNNKSFTHIV